MIKTKQNVKGPHKSLLTGLVSWSLEHHMEIYFILFPLSRTTSWSKNHQTPAITYSSLCRLWDGAIPHSQCKLWDSSRCRRWDAPIRHSRCRLPPHWCLAACVHLCGLPPWHLNEEDELHVLCPSIHLVIASDKQLCHVNFFVMSTWIGYVLIQLPFGILLQLPCSFDLWVCHVLVPWHPALAALFPGQFNPSPGKLIPCRASSRSQCPCCPIFVQNHWAVRSPWCSPSVEGRGLNLLVYCLNEWSLYSCPCGFIMETCSF